MLLLPICLEIMESSRTVILKKEILPFYFASVTFVFVCVAGSNTLNLFFVLLQDKSLGVNNRDSSFYRISEKVSTFQEMGL